MNINRHNYETFFLLYVDNELSAAERKAVEQFVQENTDLETELQLLLETTLPSETVSFNAKHSLYKNEVDQENLLLHLDKELDPISAGKIEAAIASNHSTQHEWNILRQTKLDANEKIVFENKAILYRHEGSRVIAIRFWRIAVAAAILFAVLFTGISLLRKAGPAENNLVKNSSGPSTEKQTNNGSLPGKITVDPPKTIPVENTASVTTKEQKQNDPSVNTDDRINTVPVKNENIAANKLNKDEKRNLPKTSLDNINKQASNETVALAVLNKNNATVLKNKVPTEIANVSMKEKITAPDAPAPIIDYNSVPAMPDSYATTAVFNETDAGNNNKILYMNEETVTRSKIGGLFRRVKRVIERNTNIKTGNGVRIAGFEIAVK